MKKSSFFLYLLIFALLLSVGVHADMGPKTSVRITFEGMGDDLCYGTLLSEEDRSGPAQAWDGTEKDARHDQNPDCMIYDPMPYDLWKAFVEYQDTDGFYFLQEHWNVAETGDLNWTYYPPDVFKILLYYPESNTFAVSGIYKRDAFHSCFTVDLSGMEIASVKYEQEKSETESEEDVNWWAEFEKEHAADGETTEEPILDVPDEVQPIIVKKTPSIVGDVVSFLVRLVLTVLLEWGLALLFGYRSKKQGLLIGVVNIATQILLNVGLYLGYPQVDTIFYLYLFLEILIFGLEALVYILYLQKEKQSRAVVYALCANLLSFGAGLLIAEWLPYLF